MPWLEEDTEETNTLPVDTSQPVDVALPPELPNTDLNTLEPASEAPKAVSSWVEEPEQEAAPVTTNWVEEEPTESKWIEEEKPSEFRVKDMAEGFTDSFKTTPLGVMQRGLAAAEELTSPDQVIPGTDGLTIKDLRGGGVDVAKQFEDKANKAKEEGRYGYRAGELTGAITKTAPLLLGAPLAVAGGAIGAGSGFTRPETEEMSGADELKKSGKQALKEGAIGAVLAPVGGKLIGNKYTAAPTIGALAGLMYGDVKDSDNIGRDIMFGTGLSTAAMLTGKFGGKIATASSREIVKRVEGIANKLGWNKKPEPELDIYDIPPTNLSSKPVTEADKITDGPIASQLDMLKDKANDNLELAYNSIYDRQSYNQNLEASIRGVDAFKDRAEAPLTSAIRASKNIDTGIVAAPFEDGFPVFKPSVTAREAIGDDAINTYNTVAGGITGKYKLTPDTVINNAWVRNPEATSVKSLLKEIDAAKADPDKVFQYMRDLRVAEDWNKIGKVETRNNIFYRAVDDEGNILGRYLDEQAAKQANPTADIQEIKGKHFIKTGVNGETLGVFESKKFAESGLRADIGDNIDEVAARIAETEKQPWAEPMKQQFNKYFKEGIDFLANPQNGNLSGEEAARITNSYKNYFPAYRVQDVADSGYIKGTGPSAKKGVARAKGGNEEYLDPTQSLVIWTNRITGAANKNRTLNRTFDLYEAKAAQDPAWWDKTFKTSYDDYLKQANGTTKVKADSEELQAAIKSGEPVELAERLTVGDMATSPTQAKLSFYRNGNRVEVEVKDPTVAKSIKGLNLGTWNNSVTKLLRDYRNVKRYSITSTPVFALVQFFTDSVGYGMHSRTGLIPLLATGQGARLQANKNLRKFYELNTGGGSTWAKLAEAKTDRQIKQVFNEYVPFMERSNGVLGVIKSAWESKPLTAVKNVWEAPSNIGENAPRQVEFFRTLSKDKNVPQAAVASEEVTVPFKTKGSSELLNNLGQMQTFINATLQVQDRALRYIKYHPQEFAAKVGGGLVIPSLAIQQQAINDLGSDKYYQISEDIRRQNLIIAKNSLPQAVQDKLAEYKDTVGNVEYFKIPMDPFYYGLFAAPFVALVDDLNQGTGGQQLGNQLAKSVINNVGIPTPIPVPIDIYMDLAANEDYRGAPITPGYLKDMPKEEQYRDDTSLAAREMGKLPLGLTPIEIDYIGQNTFGSLLYDLGTKYSTDKALRNIKNYPDQPDQRPQDNPFLRRFAGGEGAMDYDNTYKMFKLMEELDQEKTVYNNYLKKLQSPEPDTQLTAQNWLKDNEKLVGFMDYMADSFTEMDNITKEAREVARNGDIKGSEKRRQIDDLMKIRENFAREQLDRIRTDKNLREFYSYVYGNAGVAPIFNLNLGKAAAKQALKGGEFMESVDSKVKEEMKPGGNFSILDVFTGKNK